MLDTWAARPTPGRADRVTVAGWPTLILAESVSLKPTLTWRVARLFRALVSEFWSEVTLDWSLVTLVLPLVTALLPAVALDLAVVSADWSWDSLAWSCWSVNESVGQSVLSTGVAPVVHPSLNCL